MQCLSHTRGLRDYCLLKLYRQEKFSKEDAKLTEGVCSSVMFHPFPLHLQLFTSCHCFLTLHASFLSAAVRPLGWKWRGHGCKSTTVLQSLQRGGAIFQRLQVREERGSFYFLISYSMLYMPCKMKTAFWGRYITASSSDMNKRVCISVNAVNRMHRSSSGSYWISCIQKSTAGPLFADHWRSLNKNTPDSGVCVYGTDSIL